MRDWKLLLCAAFFLALTALRFFFPAETALTQRFVADTLDRQRSCRAFALRLGRELEAFDPQDRLIAVFQSREAGQ